MWFWKSAEAVLPCCPCLTGVKKLLGLGPHEIVLARLPGLCSNLSDKECRVHLERFVFEYEMLHGRGDWLAQHYLRSQFFQDFAVQRLRRGLSSFDSTTGQEQLPGLADRRDSTGSATGYHVCALSHDPGQGLVGDSKNRD
jgi:hypothetical protein